jgi:hypothetical protein
MGVAPTATKADGLDGCDALIIRCGMLFLFPDFFFAGVAMGSGMESDARCGEWGRPWSVLVGVYMMIVKVGHSSPLGALTFSDGYADLQFNNCNLNVIEYLCGPSSTCGHMRKDQLALF